MTRLYNSNINSMTLPALDDMKRKHENGGILKYQNPATTLDLPEGSEYEGELKPAVVKPKPYLGILNTYYPIISEYPFTGHSELDLYDSDGVFVNHISKYGDNYDYNLVTNNCSDATRRAVEKIFGEKINPYLFTTPGDVQDFVVEKTGQKPAKEGAGQTSLEFNIPFATAMDLKNQNLDFYIQDYLYKARKIKKQMKEENPNWNSDSFDLSTSEVIQRYEDQKYKFQPFKNKKGGSIHIKKKNRGKFTEYCGGKVTEECIAKGKKSKDPKIRKRATFAANARKWKHENGGILKAQNGTPYGLPGGIPSYMQVQPLSPVGIALNHAKASAKMREQQHLPPGVKEVVGPNGQKIAVRTEQPLVPLEQSIAEWMPGTGDVAEVGYIANDVKNGNYGTAALGAGLMFIPGNAGKLLSKYRKTVSKTADVVEDAARKANVSEYINTVDDALPERQPLTTNKSKQFWDGTSKSDLMHEEKLGIPKGERSNYKQSLGKSKISPEEKAGVPKGERNNGKYKGITFFRSSHEVPQIDENGFAILTDPDNWFLNTTTDGLLHTHGGYPYLRTHAYAIDPEAFRGSTLFSTEPSDMFFLNSSVKVKPKHIIFISGDEAALKEAAALGYQTMTSPQLKIGFKRSRFGGDWRLKQYDYHNDLRNFVSSRFSRPTMDVYEKISEQTTLPISVKPFTGKNFVPTGADVDWSPSDFRHVVYDPASPVEYQFKQRIGLPDWGRCFDSRSLWQRIKDQSRLQDAAKQVRPLKAGGKL